MSYLVLCYICIAVNIYPPFHSEIHSRFLSLSLSWFQLLKIRKSVQMQFSMIYCLKDNIFYRNISKLKNNRTRAPHLFTYKSNAFNVHIIVIYYNDIYLSLIIIVAYSDFRSLNANFINELWLFFRVFVYSPISNFKNSEERRKEFVHSFPREMLYLR